MIDIGEEVLKRLTAREREIIIGLARNLEGKSDADRRAILQNLPLGTLWLWTLFKKAQRCRRSADECRNAVIFYERWKASNLNLVSNS